VVLSFSKEPSVLSISKISESKNQQVPGFKKKQKQRTGWFQVFQNPQRTEGSFSVFSRFF
jgi:hypothetical protein